MTRIHYPSQRIPELLNVGTFHLVSGDHGRTVSVVSSQKGRKRPNPETGTRREALTDMSNGTKDIQGRGRRTRTWYFQDETLDDDESEKRSHKSSTVSLTECTVLFEVGRDLSKLDLHPEVPFRLSDRRRD